MDAYIDELIAERERGYTPSAAELARIKASREGRRRARVARAHRRLTAVSRRLKKSKPEQNAPVAGLGSKEHRRAEPRTKVTPAPPY